MHLIKRSCEIFGLMLLLQACSSPVPVPDRLLTERPGQSVKNIILMIGDGMGPEHRRLAQLIENEPLAMEQLPIQGQVHTDSFNGEVTDSAAAATAMATGIKTRNKYIGLDADKNTVSNITEAAKAAARASGLITTTQITHATPAAFVAHIDSRKKMCDIALQMATANIDVLMGGGEACFLPENLPGCHGASGKRNDGINLIEMMQSDGMYYICTREELLQLNTSSEGRLLGLFAAEDMPRPFSPTLAEMTSTALNILSRQPRGFFLMVEGGQIDWGSHKNNALEVMQSLRGFDQAVRVASRFAAEHGDTLLIVTADHETGGLEISWQQGDEGPFTAADGRSFYINWATEQHTAVDVPLTATGPMADLLQGEIDNTRIYYVISRALH